MLFYNYATNCIIIIERTDKCFNISYKSVYGFILEGGGRITSNGNKKRLSA